MKDIAILFDLDGTLLDTLTDLYTAINHALRGVGARERSLEQVRRFVGNGAAVLAQRALDGSGKEQLWEQVLAEFRCYYDAHCRVETRPYPGILQALEQLRQEGYPMAVVSNKPDSAVQILCRDYFGDLFRHTQGEVPGCPRKPAPDMPLLAAERLGVPAERCVYVGDSEVDVETARNAGMVCLSVTWGFRDMPELVQAGGKHFCAYPRQLPEKIRQLEEELHGK